MKNEQDVIQNTRILAGFIIGSIFSAFLFIFSNDPLALIGGFIGGFIWVWSWDDSHFDGKWNKEPPCY